VPQPADTPLVEAVARCLADALHLAPAVAATLDARTPLFGNLPELDSMAVATVLTALEDRFHILIDDEDVTAELFETLGSLSHFVAERIQAPGRLS
jgi:acyl carrier protein